MTRRRTVAAVLGAAGVLGLAWFLLDRPSAPRSARSGEPWGSGERAPSLAGRTAGESSPAPAPEASERFVRLRVHLPSGLQPGFASVSFVNEAVHYELSFAEGQVLVGTFVGVRVKAAAESSCGPGELCARISGLPPGSYTARAWAAPRMDGEATAASRVVRVTIGPGVTPVDLDLQPFSERTGIRASVRSGDVPVESTMTLRIDGLEGWGPSSGTEAWFGPLVPGQDAEVRVVSIPGTRTEDLPPPQTVRIAADGPTLVVFQATKPPWHRVALRAVDADGKALGFPEAHVFLLSPSDGGAPMRIGLPMSGGRWSGSAPAGRYGVRVRNRTLPGQFVLSAAWKAFDVPVAEAAEFVVPVPIRGDTVTLRLLTADGTPAFNRSVTIRRDTEEEAEALELDSSTDRAGRTFPLLLPRGRYDVLLHEENVIHRRSILVSGDRTETIDVVAPTPLPETATAQLSVRVLVGDRLPPGDILVIASTRGVEWGFAARGGSSVSFRGVAPGTVTLTVVPPWGELASWKPFSKDLEVRAGDRASTELRLVPRGVPR